MYVCASGGSFWAGEKEQCSTRCRGSGCWGMRECGESGCEGCRRRRGSRGSFDASQQAQQAATQGIIKQARGMHGRGRLAYAPDSNRR
jgi:hypothetical protein